MVNIKEQKAEVTTLTLKVSVVVPTHGRQHLLARLLESLAAQTLPESAYEVIVVDDGSPIPVNPAQTVKANNQRVVSQAQQGPAAARNAGANMARGKLLAFIDDDCTASADWLEQLLAANESPVPLLLGGTTGNGLPDNLFSATAESLLHFFDDYQLAHHQPIDFLASNNIACDHQAFNSIDGFDTRYPLAAGEDREFCRRWQTAGWLLKRVPEARATHFHQLDLRRFWRQQYNYGRGAARFHASSSSASTPPRPLGFYLSLLVHPVLRQSWPWWQRIACLPLVALSQVAVISGRLYQSSLRE